MKSKNNLETLKKNRGGKRPLIQKQAKIDDEARFVETYKKGVFNNKLREILMLRDPPITTRVELKAAVSNAQVGMLKYTKTFSNSNSRVRVTPERRIGNTQENQ